MVRVNTVNLNARDEPRRCCFSPASYPTLLAPVGTGRRGRRSDPAPTRIA